MEISESLIPQVAQLKAEREVCAAHGNSDRVAAIDRQLAALGIVDEDEPQVTRAVTESPQGRSAPQARQEKAAAK